MAIKCHKPEEIVSKLRQVDVLVGQGIALRYSVVKYSVGTISSTAASAWRDSLIAAL